MTPVISGAVILGVALGGSAGAVVRLLLDRFLPFGILAANTLGCFLLGFLYGEMSHLGESQSVSWLFTEAVMTVVVFGLLGALSTFATVSLNVAQLWISQRRAAAIGMWTLHVGCGFAAAAAGIAVSGF